MIKLLAKNKLYIVVILILIIAEPVVASVLNFWLQKLFSLAQPGNEMTAILRLLTIGFLLWMGKRLISFTVSVI